MKKLVYIAVLLLTLHLALAATIEGTVYTESLEVATDVLIEIDSTPQQKYLSKDGMYGFDIGSGSYTITARRGMTVITEQVTIVGDGTFVYDIFLIPNLQDEEELWEDTSILDEEEPTGFAAWRYVVAVVIFLLILWRFGIERKKHGSVYRFRKRMKAESKKSVEEHKADLEKEPSYVEKVIEILKKHDGRISQKQLRKEMLYLSESKVSLIITELEHKGLVEKVKKGRGNVILLK
jgi:uncharacterized membrane protein